jgi:hypothetical protein
MRSPQNCIPWRRLRPDNARTGDLIGWPKVSCLLSPGWTNARKSIPRLQSLPCPCVPFCRTARPALTQIVTTDDEHCPTTPMQGRSREKLRLGLRMKIKALTEVRVETKVTSVSGPASANMKHDCVIRDQNN